jgi:hypothetical protein
MQISWPRFYSTYRLSKLSKGWNALEGTRENFFRNGCSCKSCTVDFALNYKRLKVEDMENISKV